MLGFERLWGMLGRCMHLLVKPQMMKAYTVYHTATTAAPQLLGRVMADPVRLC